MRGAVIARKEASELRAREARERIRTRLETWLDTSTVRIAATRPAFREEFPGGVLVVPADADKAALVTWKRVDRELRAHLSAIGETDLLAYMHWTYEARRRAPTLMADAESGDVLSSELATRFLLVVAEWVATPPRGRSIMRAEVAKKDGELLSWALGFADDE